MTLIRPYPTRTSRHTIATCLAALLVAVSSFAAFAETPRSADAWIDSFERAMVARSGRVLTVSANSEAGPAEPLHAVFYAPLSAVWLLSEPDGTEVFASGFMHRGDTGQSFVTITWDTGDLTTLTEVSSIPAAGNVHPLADFHNRLLSRPLETPLAGLPSGSRFMAAGIVETLAPQKSDQATTPSSEDGATLWNSLGDHIVITSPDGSRKTFGWRAVDAALKGVEQ